MQSINLDFKGPFDNKLFRKDGQQRPELPGVYIWGFMINEQFIPYYVGKHQSSIANRISDHIHDITKDDSTYMRLTRAYMEDVKSPYFSDPNFPLIATNFRKDRLPAWFKENKEHFSKRISYLNNLEFIQQHNSGVTKVKDYPISLMDGIDDYLSDNIGRLRVMYAECQYSSTYGVKKDFYELIEAFTKFHLKGKTVSKSLPFATLKQRLEDSVKISINADYRTIFKDSISDEFPGY